MLSCMILFPFWHYKASCKLKVKRNVGNLTFSFIAFSFVFSFWLSRFQLIESFHQKVYVCVEEHVFLFHVCASTDVHWVWWWRLISVGVESAISLMVSGNSLDLGWNTAADLWDSLHNNIDCLINQGVFPSNSLTFRMCIMSID